MIKKTLVLAAVLVAVVAGTMAPGAATASNQAAATKCPPGSTDQDYCQHGHSAIRVASTVAVVFHTGETSIDLACFGVARCNGTLTISKGGKIFASAAYSIGGDAVGAVNLKLSTSALNQVQKNPGLDVTVTAVDTTGSTDTSVIRLYPA